jgi:predicted nuclease of predicted toxin-antitoxin system
VRFLLDENISHHVCTGLNGAGHDAIHVRAIGLDCTDDGIILAHARSDGRVVISCDHDFVQLLFASGDTRPSLILTREVNDLPSGRLAELLVAALSPELEELLANGAIATLTRERVRVRPLPLHGVRQG